MRRTHPLSILALVLALLPWLSMRAAEPKPTPVGASFAYKWLDIVLETCGREVDRDGARPTILSRAMAKAMTAMYDAWACYDEKASSVSFAGTLRRPPAERTLDNKKKAISYAVYRVLLNLYSEDEPYITGEFVKLGYDPKDTSVDPATPQGLGNKVAAAVIEYRRHDGANQYGDEIGCNGKPYSDYTYYKPINTPDKILEPDRWMPITFSDGKGGTVTPGFLTPHWYRVKTFALASPSQFRPGPPLSNNIPQLMKEAKECIEVNGHLTDEQKAIVEFMRDGPRSTGQSGHWLRFAQDVSVRDKNDLDTDVKLYFTVANTAMDAFVSCWECKRYYDTSRPYWYARIFYKDLDIKGWGGPGKGVVDMKGKDWLPYSPATFITPPFPGYTSGHATVSGACGKILELFTGSDNFGAFVSRNCCVLTEPVPGPLITLKLPTFTAAADMAAVSRMLGGYHIRTDNEVGVAAGRKLAEYEWAKYKECFEGTGGK